MTFYEKQIIYELDQDLKRFVIHVRLGQDHPRNHYAKKRNLSIIISWAVQRSRFLGFNFTSFRFWSYQFIQFGPREKALVRCIKISINAINI